MCAKEVCRSVDKGCLQSDYYYWLWGGGKACARCRLTGDQLGMDGDFDDVKVCRTEFNGDRQAVNRKEDESGFRDGLDRLPNGDRQAVNRKEDQGEFRDGMDRLPNGDRRLVDRKEDQGEFRDEMDRFSNGDRQVVIRKEDEVEFRDEMDRLPNGGHVTYWDLLVLFVSIISHLLDVAFDINLAYRYLIQHHMGYFVLTTAFIMFPAFVNTFVSVRMYVVNDDINSPSRMVIKKWTIRIFMLIFQLAPIMRYCDSLDYALKSRRAEKRKDTAEQKRNYLLMLKEDSDVALLRVFECFLEAAPQQILQIAIVLSLSSSPSPAIQGTGDYFQLISSLFLSDKLTYQREFIFMLLHQTGSIVSSLLSMAWSMASYHRSIRFCQADKSNLTWPASVIQFLWHFMVTVSRILSISAVASLFPVATGVFCCAHWILMTFWLAFFEKTQFAIAQQSSLRAKLSEIIFCSILGLVYIFTYLTPSEGNTRNRYLIYYPICFVENIAAVVLWSTFTSPETRYTWYYYPLLLSGIVPFIVGIIFMLLFYHFFHPKTSRRLTTPNVYSPKAASTRLDRPDASSIRDIVSGL